MSSSPSIPELAKTERLDRDRLFSLAKMMRESQGSTRVDLTGLRMDEVLDVPSRDAGRTLRTHIYYPKKREIRAADAGPAPAVINVHGSGYVMPYHGVDDEYARTLADRANVVVLDASYRLAPENPFPAAYDDVVDAIRYVLSKPETFDPSRISLSGFSAGGTLILAAASQAFDKTTFKNLITIYPGTLLGGSELQKRPADTEPVDDKLDLLLPDWANAVFIQSYIQDPDLYTDPRVSPHYASPQAFPDRMLFITAGYDVFCPEAEELAAKIQSNDPAKEVIVHRMKNFGHGFDKKPLESDPHNRARDEAYGLVVDFLMKDHEVANHAQE